MYCTMHANEVTNAINKHFYGGLCITMQTKLTISRERLNSIRNSLPVSKVQGKERIIDLKAYILNYKRKQFFIRGKCITGRSNGIRFF